MGVDRRVGLRHRRRVANGGAGTILGACLGMILLTTLEMGLVLDGSFGSDLSRVAGIFLILAVVLNTYLSRGDRCQALKRGDCTQATSGIGADVRERIWGQP